MDTDLDLDFLDLGQLDHNITPQKKVRVHGTFILFSHHKKHNNVYKETFAGVTTGY